MQAQQLPLFKPRDLTVDERFNRYHKDNPHVFFKFRMLAAKKWEEGYRHYGSKALFEELRHNMKMETKDVEGFGLNNTYTRPYAEKLMTEYPKFRGFFKTREQRVG